LLGEGHLAQAEGELREALSLAPNNPQTPRILVALGRVAAARKQGAEATGYFTRALALDPTESEARQALAQLSRN
ncbi:MAG: tetratricopeptide repeat protein, partial [Ktedonobacterales bacterium]